MYLKSIEIQGFKSFPDKTLLTFSDGITAVVGPNGSGKSNIADAIRWVLGEQSVKTLRGGKMEDVIFGGTKRRSPMGFCEVSITVDNSDNSINLDYTDVTVTRRYYRSGDSDFFINRRAVRLKDVRELFMDTGLGRDGYSMIGQGKIDEILSVKSAERREIFEEAAGISKVRHRKEESRRKLDQAEDNLVRIRDIITELEGRVAPLQKQAEKVKKFLLLHDELRVLEVSYFLDTLARLDETIKVTGIDFDNADRLLMAKKAELEAFYAQSEEIGEGIRQKDIEIEGVRNSLEITRSALAETSSHMAVCEANLQNAAHNMEMRRREAQEQLDKKQNLSAQLDEKVKRQAEIKISLAQNAEAMETLTLQIEEAGRQAKDIFGKVEALSAALALERDREQSKRAEIMSLDATQGEIESRLDVIFWESKDTAERLERQNETIAEIESELGQAEEGRQSALNSIKGYELMQKTRTERAEKAQNALAALQREIDSKSDRLNMLRALERDYEGFSFAVKKIMQAGSALNGIHGPLSSLIKTDDRYSVAIETALGAGMQNIVVDDENSAKAAMGYLKANNFGRATFLPITSVNPRWKTRSDLTKERGFCGYGESLITYDSEYSNIFLSLLGTTAVVDNIDSAIALSKKYKYSFRVVTLDGQQVNAGGSMTGGSLVKGTGVLTRNNEINRLGNEIEELKTNINEAAETSEKATRELTALTYQQTTANEELKACDEVISLTTAKKSREDAIAETLSLTIENLSTEHERLAQRKSQLEADKAALAAEAEAYAEKADALKNEIEELSKGIDRDDEASGGLEQRLTDLKLEKSALEAEGLACQNSVEMLEGLIRESTFDEQQKAEQTKEALALIDQLKLDIEGYKAQITLQEGERKAFEDEIEHLTKSRLELDGAKQRLEREVQNKNNEIINQERERIRLENKKTQLEAEHNGILDKLWESYELTVVTARDIYQKPEDTAAAERRISELRGQIKGLGSINLDAVEEYEEVNARYTFMAAQRDDLEKAKADLTEVIGRLTQNMEVTFAESFAKINQSFSQTFTDIFGGGSAYLKLEDEKNILECGIDISVELPGKGRRAISLLSGGEKAFVAIALYFAIIKVSPTPFCVMDEIDAALDDINTVRFAEYMRLLCNTTQFIVITHRRGTMEGSDILYGATMQEHGVTKLLKLDVKEVESRLNIKLT